MFASPYSSSYYHGYNPYFAQQQAQLQLQRQREIERQRALQLELERQRAAVAHAQRLRRAQYLPYGYDFDNYSDGEDDSLERAYAEELRRQALGKKRLEAIRQELARRQQLEALRQQELAREQEMEAIRQELARRREIQEQLQAREREQFRQIQEHLKNLRFKWSPSEFTGRSPTPSFTNEHVPSPPPAAPEPQTAAPSAPSPAPPASASPTPEQLDEAATKIQTTYRAHRALRTVADLEHQFDALASSFSLPFTIDYQTPEGVVTVTTSTPSTSSPALPETPKLAYSPTNYAIHSYNEELSRLLLKLDGVESWGDASVRKNRRRVVSRIEEEASKLEAHWKQIWAEHLRSLEGAVALEEPATTNEVEEVEEPLDVFASLDVEGLVKEEAPAVEEAGTVVVADDEDAQVAVPMVQAVEAVDESTPAEKEEEEPTPEIVDPISTDAQEEEPDTDMDAEGAEPAAQVEAIDESSSAEEPAFEVVDQIPADTPEEVNDTLVPLSSEVKPDEEEDVVDIAEDLTIAVDSEGEDSLSSDDDLETLEEIATPLTPSLPLPPVLSGKEVEAQPQLEEGEGFVVL